MPKITAYEKKGMTYYMFKIYVGVDPATGKKKYTTRRGLKTKALAKKTLTELEYKIANEGVNYNKRKLVTYNDVYELWLEQYKNQVRESTYKQVKSIFRNNIIPALGHYRIDAITPIMCQELTNKWFSKFASYNKIVMYTSIIFNYAVKNLDLIAKNPISVLDLGLFFYGQKLKSFIKGLTFDRQ